MAIHAITEQLEGKEIETAEIAKATKLHTQEDWTREAAKELLSALWRHYEVFSPIHSERSSVKKRKSILMILDHS